MKLLNLNELMEEKNWHGRKCVDENISMDRR